MTGGAEALALTAEELHCLASMTGLTQVTGLGPMPFGGRPDVEPLLWGTAARSLTARDLPDEGVAEALAIIGRPERTVAVQRGGLGGVGVRSFWLAGGRGVELRRVEAYDYLLARFDAGELTARVLAAAELAGATNGDVPGAPARLARTALLAALAGSPAPGLPPLDDATLWEAQWLTGGEMIEGATLTWLDAPGTGTWRVVPDGDADDAGDAADGVVALEPVSGAALARELRVALDG